MMNNQKISNKDRHIFEESKNIIEVSTCKFRKLSKIKLLFCSGEALSFVKGDVRDFIFDHDSYGFLTHAATPTSTKLEAEDPDEMYSIIVEVTKHVLDFTKHTGVKKIF